MLKLRWQVMFFVLLVCLVGCKPKNIPELAANSPSAASPVLAEGAAANPELVVSGKSVLYVVLAATDTCQDKKLQKKYVANREAKADADALEEFLTQQEAGSLYAQVVVRKLYGQDFTKNAFAAALDEIALLMNHDDVLLIYLSAYSGIDSGKNLFIIPWDGKKSASAQNIMPRDIAKKVFALESRRVMLLVDTGRKWKPKQIYPAIENFAESIGWLPLIVTEDSSAKTLMGNFENAGFESQSSGDLRYVQVNDLQLSSVAVRNFILVDRFPEQQLDLADTRLASNVIAGRTSTAQGQSLASLSALTARLPSFGVNAAELNPANYQKIDKDVLSAMGMEQSRIAYLAGEKFYQAGSYDQAIAEFNRSAELRPDYADIYIARGHSYRKKGNIVRAIDDFSLALKYSGERAEVYNYRGFAYAERGDHGKAIADFSQAIRFKKDYADAFINRAHAHYDTGSYAKAIDDYTEVLRLEPGNAQVWNQRGSVWSVLSDYEKAVADFSHAIELRKDYTLAWHNRGNAWYNSGDFEKALADLNQAIKLSPSANAYTSRGNILQKLGDASGAEADFATAQRLRNSR